MSDVLNSISGLNTADSKKMEHDTVCAENSKKHTVRKVVVISLVACAIVFVAFVGLWWMPTPHPHP